MALSRKQKMRKYTTRHFTHPRKGKPDPLRKLTHKVMRSWKADSKAAYRMTGQKWKPITYKQARASVLKLIMERAGQPAGGQ